MLHGMHSPYGLSRGIRLEKHRSRSLKKEIRDVEEERRKEAAERGKKGKNAAEERFLLIPLYGGEESSARLVKAGDRVEKYQALTSPVEEPVVFSPSAGVVEEIRPVEIPLEGSVLCARLRLLCDGEEEQKVAGKNAGRSGANGSFKRVDAGEKKNSAKEGGEAVLIAAERAGIRDEFDGTPLSQLAKRFRASGVKVLVGCGLDDDPYADSSGAVLREHSREAAEGLRMFAGACGVEKNILAATSFYTWRRVRAAEQGTPVVSMGGKTPAKGVLAGRLRRSLGKAGFVGAQACAALYRAVQEGMPQTDTVVTVAGDGVWRAGNLRVPIGTPIGELLERCGVLPDTKLVYIGPAISGEAVTDLSLPVTQRTRCITALKQEPVNKTFACIGCGRCARVCMRGILPWLVHDVINRDTVDPMMLWNVERCTSCHSCSAACPAGIDLAAEVARAAAIRKSGDFE